jgi:hypothetical protein
MTQQVTGLDGLVPFLDSMPLADQLCFWTGFRRAHRVRIASTEAELCPELLAEVDAVIARLKSYGGVK